MYCHTPKEPSFAGRNKIQSLLGLWRRILDQSDIDDYDTRRVDDLWATGGLVPLWQGGETDYFSEALGRPVSGYLEGFVALLKQRNIETYLDLIPVIEEIRREVPGLAMLQIPEEALRLKEEADGAASLEVGWHEEGEGIEAEDWRQCAGTPPDLFAVLHAEYRFDIDVCAAPFNTKLPEYLTREDDALTCRWEGRCWCNPPYKDIPAWLAHALEPDFVAFLLPVRSDRNWWRKWKSLAECHYFVGEAPHRRIQFVPPPGCTYSSNPGHHCLFLFGAGCDSGREHYRSGRTGARL